jgi:hypothetical protein
MTLPSNDYIAKLEWSRRHLEDLNTIIEEFFSKDHRTVITEKDPEGGPNSFRVRVIADPLPIDLPVMMGDVLHNMRCTLDHLVYEMAAAAFSPEPLSQDIAETSEFPIVGDINSHGVSGSGQRMFDAAITTKLRGIPPEAQTIIQGLQPYHGGNNFKAHPLWALHELSNIDKHRKLLVGTLVSAAAPLIPERSFNYGFTSDVDQRYDILLEPEAVIIRYSVVPRDPSKEMHVEFGPMLEVVFNCGSSVDGEYARAVLFNIFNFIEFRVIPPLIIFL